MNHLIYSCKESNKTTNSMGENIIDPKLFVRYGSKFSIWQKINCLSVILVLFYKDSATNRTILESMILQLHVWYLCEIQIIHLCDCLEDKFGFTYFAIKLSEMEYVINDWNTRDIPGRNINL